MLPRSTGEFLGTTKEVLGTTKKYHEFLRFYQDLYQHLYQDLVLDFAIIYVDFDLILILIQFWLDLDLIS